MGDFSCADPGIFVRGGGGGRGGGPGQSDKKALTTCFFFLFVFCPQRKMVNFKEIYHFSRFQRGSNFFQGGGGGGWGPIAYSL